MSLPSPVAFCPICGKKIAGRRDKIFCSTTCKSEYHRKRRKQVIPYAKEIDAKLHRNWIILQELYEKSQSRKIFINKAELHLQGFNFDYHTTSKTNKEGKTYHYIYNFGWMDFSEKEVMVLHLNKPK